MMFGVNSQVEFRLWKVKLVSNEVSGGENAGFEPSDQGFKSR